MTSNTPGNTSYFLESKVGRGLTGWIGCNGAHFSGHTASVSIPISCLPLPILNLPLQLPICSAWYFHC